MSKFKREYKYVVLSHKDLDQYIDDKQKEVLIKIVGDIQRKRRSDGKKVKNYICIAEDWPMYESTWNALEKWVDAVDTEVSG